MIDHWEVVSDDIGEQMGATGTTILEIWVRPEDGESADQAIVRGSRECYEYVDSNGFYGQLNLEHPRNDFRFNRGLRPVFQSSFKFTEDKENPYLFHGELQWAVPEKIDSSLALDREPPRRVQWSDRRAVIHDPNTGRLFTTTAGEIIRGIEHEERFGGFAYTYRMPSIPNWFDEMQAGPINEDMVRLDGKYYPPKSLWVQTCEASPTRGPGDVYWRELSIVILHNKHGWERIYPNVGYYEQFLLGYKADGSSIDILKYTAQDQSQVDALAAAAGNGRLTRFPFFVDPIRVERSYRPIKDQLYPSNGEDEHEPGPVKEQVPLDRNGVAYRSGGYIQGNNYGTLPVRTQIEANEVVLVRVNPYPLAKLSKMGLW